MNNLSSENYHQTAADTRNIVNVLGLSMDVISYEETIDRVVSWIKGDRQPRILLTVNSSLLVMREQNRELFAACHNVDLAVPDGVPVVWLSRMLGTPLKERVAGVDLMYSLLERGHREKLKVYFLGATQEVIDNLTRLCEQRFPDLQVVGARNGYFSEHQEEAVCDAVAESSADILFIGMPSPRKELLANLHQRRMGVPVVMGVGGSFDVITGKVRRAPRIMQSTGLEWLWRLMMEPRKLWRRYLYTNSRFLWMSIKAIVLAAFSRRAQSSKKSGPIL